VATPGGESKRPPVTPSAQGAMLFLSLEVPDYYDYGLRSRQRRGGARSATGATVGVGDLSQEGALWAIERSTRTRTWWPGRGGEDKRDAMACPS